MTDKSSLPLVYSCSGCSSSAQMSNHFAIALDRRGLAEMSCIAGVGGDVPSLVKVARKAAETGRPIIAIDGCALTCVQHALARHGIEPTVAHELQNHEVRKIKGQDFDPDEANEVFERVILPTVPQPIPTETT
ncbi:MAG: putative zinc-binding protein [Acidimicrobiia bacterium]|nr:putative zinc-binding protein [Acidimicrobiia bacterium]